MPLHLILGGIIGVVVGGAIGYFSSRTKTKSDQPC
jgi:hypothetical protein